MHDDIKVKEAETGTQTKSIRSKMNPFDFLIIGFKQNLIKATAY